MKRITPVDFCGLWYAISDAVFDAVLDAVFDAVLDAILDCGMRAKDSNTSATSLEGGG